jgi:hypothetical protein
MYANLAWPKPLNLTARLQSCSQSLRKLQKQKMGTKPIKKFHPHYTNQFNELETQPLKSCLFLVFIATSLLYSF